MKLAGREGRKWRSEREGGSVGGGEEEKSRGEIREKNIKKKKPKRALTKGPVNLQAPLTRGMDGNSLTAHRIFFFFLFPSCCWGDQVALWRKGCNHLLAAASSTRL